MEFFTTGECMMIYRKRAKLSKKQLSEMTELSVSKISSYESDAALPEMEEIKKISLALNVSSNRLLAGFDDPNCNKYLSGLMKNEDSTK